MKFRRGVLLELRRGLHVRVGMLKLQSSDAEVTWYADATFKPALGRGDHAAFGRGVHFRLDADFMSALGC